MAFQAYDVKAEFVSPQAVVRHLSSEQVIATFLPAFLKDTAFKDLNTFCTLFNYCLDGITQPIEFSGLPFRLTNDSMLNEFTTVDGLYVTTHWRVLPDLKEMFLHEKLVRSCISWFKKHNTSEEAYISGVFKKFTIYELALHLGKHLPEDWQECDHHVDWTPNKNGHPSESWLRHMWEFICSETSETSGDIITTETYPRMAIIPNYIRKIGANCIV